MALLDAYRSALANVGGSGLGETFGPGTQAGILQVQQKKREEERAREREGLTFVLDRAIKAGDRRTIESVGPRLYPSGVDFGAVGQAAEREVFGTQSAGLRDIADLLPEGADRTRVLTESGKLFAQSRGETPTITVPETTYTTGAPRFMTEQEYGADPNLAGLLAAAGQAAPTFARTLSPTVKAQVTLSKLSPEERAAYKAFEPNLKKMGYSLPTDPTKPVALPALVRGASVPTVTTGTRDVERPRYPFERGAVPKATGALGAFIRQQQKAAQDAIQSARENLPSNLSEADRARYNQLIDTYEKEMGTWSTTASINNSLVGLTMPSASVLSGIPNVKRAEIEARTAGIKTRTEHMKALIAQMPEVLRYRGMTASAAVQSAVARMAMANTSQGRLALADEMLSLQLQQEGFRAEERSWERKFKTRAEYDKMVKEAYKAADDAADAQYPESGAKYFTGTRLQSWRDEKDAYRARQRVSELKTRLENQPVLEPLPSRPVVRAGAARPAAQPNPKTVTPAKPAAPPKPKTVTPAKVQGGAANRHGDLAGG